MKFSQILLMFYVTLFPAIVAGIINSLFCRSKLFSKLKVPMDFGKSFFDKKRIFGDNKTWKGFLGYILLNTVVQCLWGVVCNLSNINHLNLFYVQNENSVLNNLLFGFLIGLFYALFELPNSFLKRRLDIEPGKPPKGFKKVFFIILDQADSLFGIILVVALFYKMTIGLYFLFVLIGTITHLIINILLYFCKVRKNMF